MLAFMHRFLKGEDLAHQLADRFSGSTSTECVSAIGLP